MRFASVSTNPRCPRAAAREPARIRTSRTRAPRVACDQATSRRDSVLARTVRNPRPLSVGRLRLPLRPSGLLRFVPMRRRWHHGGPLRAQLFRCGKSPTPMRSNAPLWADRRAPARDAVDLEAQLAFHPDLRHPERSIPSAYIARFQRHRPPARGYPSPPVSSAHHGIRKSHAFESKRAQMPLAASGSPT